MGKVHDRHFLAVKLVDLLWRKELRLTLRLVFAITKMGILRFWRLALASALFFSFDFLEVIKHTACYIELYKLAG